MGGVSRQNYAATFPPDRFYCLLDELPLHLVPMPHRHGLRQQLDQPLYLNPDCSLHYGTQIPQDLRGLTQSLAAFALLGEIAWVHDRLSGSTLPFWLGPRLEELVRRLKPGEAVATMDPATRNLLYQARILITENHAAVRRREWDADVARAASIFQQKGYAPLSQLIHPFHVAALRRYYRYLIRTGAITLGDAQSRQRYAAYNEPVARFFHRQMTNQLSAIAGEPVKPSYVYLASYLGGAELKKHTDREQCEFSVTLCLDFAPEPDLACPWPIQLETPGETVKVYQALGDGLAYRGAQLPHYRNTLGEGQTSTSIFFHYVSADFTGSLD